MKLKPTTLNVLKNFSTINQNLKFASGNILRTTSPTKSIIAEAVLEDSISREFCVYDMNSFLGCYSMFNDADMQLGETNLELSGDGHSIRYDYASESAILLPPEGDFSDKLPPVLAKLKLSATDIANIAKSASIMGHDTFQLNITSDKTTLLVKALKETATNGNTYTQVLSETGGERDITAVFQVEQLKLLPDDYEVEIRGTEKSGFAVFKGKTCNVTYYLCSDRSSKF